MTVREIYDAIDRIAPFQTAMDFDNVGILVGDENVDVTKAFCVRRKASAWSSSSATTR